MQCSKCNKRLKFEDSYFEWANDGSTKSQTFCFDCFHVFQEEKRAIKEKERREKKEELKNNWKECILCNESCAFCNRVGLDYAFSYGRVFLCSGCWGRMPNDRCDNFLCRYIDGRNNTNFECNHTLEEQKVREEVEQQKALVEVPNK